MQLRLEKLDLACKTSLETLNFTDFNYFYGEMGAGKSTIARLIDYCLGSKEMVLTPALQSEFVSVSLDLRVGSTKLNLERQRASGQLLARWDDQQVIVPARTAAGPVIPNTEVEVLSDLIFHLNGMKPPRVRRSQLKEDSDLERLSLRDLLWYCYLDQDSMDSSFFNLDLDAETFRRLKSRNVLRAILGIHQERVAELELRLEEIHRERVKCSEAAKLLADTLDEAGVSTEPEIAERTQQIERERLAVEQDLERIRESKKALQGHLTDTLRARARQIGAELEAVQSAQGEVTATMSEDRRHRNEMLALSTKVRRLDAARAVLNGVEFERCPRCTQPLPTRSPVTCRLCGQAEDDTTPAAEQASERTQADVQSRSNELEEMLDAQAIQLKRLRRREQGLRDVKSEIDAQLSTAMSEYDSAYLAEAIELERTKSALVEELRYLQKLKTFVCRVQQLKTRADQLQGEEASVRRELKEAREAADRDLSNLRRLTTLFLDCLIRAKISGFDEDDIVRMTPPGFLPEVVGNVAGDLVTTSFSTLGSGGKKNLFKCCFALAFHRLSCELNAMLPSLLVIDSPMKNISERENRTQFLGFHQLLYELADSELRDTQFILIDKEFCPPDGEYEFDLQSRHMRVNDEQEPPLRNRVKIT